MGETRRDASIEEEQQRQFRRGFLYGLWQAIQCLESGTCQRQLKAWLKTDIMQWRLEDSPCSWEKPAKPEPWRSIRKRILERDLYTCRYCYGKATHVDHVIPVSQGGTWDDSNLVAACATCNLTKQARRPEEVKIKGQQMMVLKPIPEVMPWIDSEEDEEMKSNGCDTDESAIGEAEAAIADFLGKTCSQAFREAAALPWQYSNRD